MFYCIGLAFAEFKTAGRLPLNPSKSKLDSTIFHGIYFPRIKCFYLEMIFSQDSQTEIEYLQGKSSDDNQVSFVKFS